MLTVTKKFSFCYGHFLPGYMGKCHRMHGHNSEVEIEVDAGPCDYKGMIVDFGDLKKIVSSILESIDHYMLNELLPEEFMPPTAENMTQWLVKQLHNTELCAGLVRVRVSETPTSWAEWRRE